MKLNTLFEQKTCPLAFEIFPPKRDAKVESIYAMLDRLKKLPSDYVSVKYSAGGNGAREYTGQIAQYLKETCHIEPLAHLTCISSNKADIERELTRFRQLGIENILALRGDLSPNGAGTRDFEHASDLVQVIRDFGGFYIVGACYPEGHPESKNLREDIDYLSEKLDAGVGHFVTQLFFDNGKFFRFINQARKKGITCPIEAGVMPIVKKEQITRTVSLSSASLPSDFTRIISRYADDAASLYEAGIDYAIVQLRDLIENGADGIHIYAMNRSIVSKRVYEGIKDLL
jgi:methylenetetrahydrofolate reductase (NADPH)